MHWESFNSYESLSSRAAEIFLDAIRRDPQIVLGLPTGRTPVRLYRELVALYARGRADFSQATTFNLDEFFGIDASHPGSYRTFMVEHLFGRVNLSPERVAWAEQE